MQNDCDNAGFKSVANNDAIITSIEYGDSEHRPIDELSNDNSSDTQFSLTFSLLFTTRPKIRRLGAALSDLIVYRVAVCLVAYTYVNTACAYVYAHGYRVYININISISIRICASHVYLCVCTCMCIQV